MAKFKSVQHSDYSSFEVSCYFGQYDYDQESNQPQIQWGCREMGAPVRCWRGYLLCGELPDR